MRLLPHEVAIGILGDRFEEGLFPDPRTAFAGKEDALRFLRDLTGEDFGLSADKWDGWFDQCPDDLERLLYEDWSRRLLQRRNQVDPQ